MNRIYDKNPSYGSGGGRFGGNGGGRIVLVSSTSVSLAQNASLVAEGSSSLKNGYGAGSGGSIVIVANHLDNYGSTMSVRGGDGNSYGGAGGGGRITLQV
jgi:hypothetical protein